MRAEILNVVSAIEKSLKLLAQRLDWETAEYRLEEFNARVEDPSLWDDPEAAQKLMRERQMLVDAIDGFKAIKQELADNIELIELGGEFSKAQVCQILMQHEKFQSEEQQSAIYEFVVRNCKEIKAEIETKLEETLAV